jgi:DNA modification methylase
MYSNLKEEVAQSNNWVLAFGDANKIIPEHIAPYSIDLCFTSPSPYAYTHQSIGIGSEHEINDYILNLVLLFDKVKNALKDNGNLFVNLVDPFSTNLGGLLFIPERIAMTMLSKGWICKGKIVWNRLHTRVITETKPRFKVDWEYVYWFAKNKNSYFDSCNGEYGNTSIFQHMTENGFPKDFLKMMIRTSSPIDGLVLDPLCSSAITGVVALGLNRKFIGIEILQEKFNAAKTNLAGL